MNGHIADTSNQVVPENTADKPMGEETVEQKHFSKYFVVRDVLPKTSQDLIDVLVVMLLNFFSIVCYWDQLVLFSFLITKFHVLDRKLTTVSHLLSL